MKNWMMLAIVLVFSVLMFSALPGTTVTAQAASAREIDVRIDDALDRFYRKVNGADALVRQARGVLVFPRVFKAGIGLGGEYGEGALRVGGKTVDYYNTVAASYGLQLGAQKKSIIILFMEQGALDQFRHSSGWKVGVDASVALIKVGAEGNIDTATINKPIIGFVIGQKGLMYDLSLEGTKITKLDKTDD